MSNWIDGGMILYSEMGKAMENMKCLLGVLVGMPRR